MVSEKRQAVLGTAAKTTGIATCGRIAAMGAFWIAWTARGAVACWGMSVLLAGGAIQRVPQRAEVLISAAGWLLLVAHVMCAFHYEHHWSHAEAYAHTAQRTADTVGWNWGGGVYANYATVALWGGGVVVLARAWIRSTPAPRWWTVLETAWIGFMILNATVVFSPRTWWVPVIGFFAGLVVVVSLRRGRRATDLRPAPPR
jgi:hypothetical protein